MQRVYQNLPLSVRLTFSALKHPNYRLWFYGQLVSLIGTWMQNTAQGYLVFQLTHSPAYLGYVGFAGGLPSLLFTLFGGVIADRMSRRTLMVITQSAMMVLAFILAGLFFSGLVQPWHIIVMAFLLGIANAFDAPARQSMVVELVDDRADLTNAIALNSTMFNAATVVGPATAGFTYALLGAGWCFTINGLSFIAVILALGLMKLKPVARISRQISAVKQIREGFQYVMKNGTIRMLITNLGIVTLLGLGMVNLLPDWAVKILHGDVTTNGLLIAARGAGALMGALAVAALGRYRMRGKLWSTGSFILALLMVIFAFTRWQPLSLVILVGLGLSFMLVANTSNAMVQSIVTDDLRGRVMSIYTLVFFGAMPIGSLLTGVLADRFGEALTVTVSGIILFGFAAWVWVRSPELRRLE